MPLPDFLIVGAPRSGTTSLDNYLDQHPQIHMAHGKELRFFNAHWNRGLDWYESRFEPLPGQLCGEATPTYMYDSEAMERIIKTVPDARLVVILRNPVQQVYSRYLIHHARGRDHRRFDETGDHYLSGGRYVEHLRRFPDAPLHVMIAERMFANPAEAYEGLCRFLGVAHTFRPTNIGEPFNSYFELRSMWIRRLSKRLPPRLRKPLTRANNRVVDPPPLPPQLHEQLKEYFAPYNSELADFLGNDLTDWRT